MIENFLRNPPTTVVLHPDPVLTTPSQPVTDIASWHKIVEIMYDVMKKHNGCGLAAPQVGLPYQVFILGTTKSLLTFINPEIIEVGDRISTEKEGCLSLPGVYVEVARPRKVKVAWTDLQGERKKATFEGWTGRAFQHEINHLQGKLILDYKKNNL